MGRIRSVCFGRDGFGCGGGNRQVEHDSTLCRDVLLVNREEGSVCTPLSSHSLAVLGEIGCSQYEY
jgi:hypothetical protein